MDLKRVFEVVFLAALVGVPVSNVIAWWFWTRAAARPTSEWRSKALLIGIVLASLNTLMFYTWLAFRLALNGAPTVWKAEKTCAGFAVYLVAAALAGAIFGVGKPRVPLAICAILGVILWLPVGFGVL